MSIRLSHIRSFLDHHEAVSLPSHGLSRAAVLFPIIEDSGSAEILLTKRTDLVEHHKGQIAFPGGMMDPEDKDAEATALREAEEEIGLPPGLVRILGRTDDLITPTGFIITPVIAELIERPRIILNKREVEEAFYAPVSLFLNASQEKTSEREWQGKKETVFSYQFGEHRIWGVTAAIIRGFLRKTAETPG
jgi:8-oxo-dGTP pyrophosphatase MutT (NUDIX family)